MSNQHETSTNVLMMWPNEHSCSTALRNLEERELQDFAKFCSECLEGRQHFLHMRGRYTPVLSYECCAENNNLYVK